MLLKAIKLWNLSIVNCLVYKYSFIKQIMKSAGKYDILSLYRIIAKRAVS